MRIRGLRGVRRLAISLVLVAPLSIPTAAYAQLYTGTQVPGVEIIDSGPSAEVLGTSGFRAQVQLPSTEVLGAQGQRSGGLAFTGADIGGLVAMGLGALTVGLVLTRRGRRVT